MKSTGGKKNPFVLLGWVVLVAALSAAAYLTGVVLARRWAVPSLALPSETPAPQIPKAQAAAAWVTPGGDPAEGKLGADDDDVWQFKGSAGQSITIEVWLHPGSGSSLEAEMAVHLLTPDGTVLAEEAGSTVLPPYLVEPRLPTTGVYRIRVVPTRGAPGRYSLGLTLSGTSAPVAPDAPLPQDYAPDETVPTAEVPDDRMPAVVSERFQWPTKRREISGWTFRDPRKPSHIGLDIAARMWDPIVAIADGTVVFADWGGGYGNLVIVEHAGGWSTYYAHLSEVVVDLGQEVMQGELLGGAGSTGYSTGPHLHFELRYRGRPVDPHIYLP